MWLTLLKRLWPYLAGAVVLGSGWIWHARQVHNADAAGYARAMAEVEQERQAERERKDAERERSDYAYQATIDELHSRVDVLSAREPVVRLCKPAPAVAVRVPQATPVADDPPDTGSAVQAGPDPRNVGPELLVYGEQCEAVRRQLASLQDWVRSVE